MSIRTYLLRFSFIYSLLSVLQLLSIIIFPFLFVGLHFTFNHLVSLFLSVFLFFPPTGISCAKILQLLYNRFNAVVVLYFCFCFVSVVEVVTTTRWCRPIFAKHMDIHYIFNYRLQLTTPHSLADMLHLVVCCSFNEPVQFVARNLHLGALGSRYGFVLLASGQMILIRIETVLRQWHVTSDRKLARYFYDRISLYNFRYILTFFLSHSPLFRFTPNVN